MKTENYKFIIELPDGSEIESGKYEYEYLEENDDQNKDNYSYHVEDDYESMLDQMENDKIEFVFNSLSIRHCKI